MNKKIIQFLLVSVCFLGCNSFLSKSPTETTTEFLNSIHEGDFTKTRTLITGHISIENIDVLEELWIINKNSFTVNPNYTVTLDSENDDESIVNVKDDFNDFKFQLLKINGSWKIIMYSCGIIDLVRGNTRSDEKGINEYNYEFGDDELRDKSLTENTSNSTNTSQDENNNFQTESDDNSYNEDNTESSDYNSQTESNDNSSSNTYQEPEREKQQITCPNCQGKGFETCRQCSGNGMMKCSRCNNKGTLWTNGREESCYECNGTMRKNCDRCHGKGNTGSCRPCRGQGYYFK